ncbi:hypothetical protein OTU49_000649 [Cherax quadricarinatus]|uniref:C2H2-type domain-containing protein n=2 Tax=Cherax quadricarinatus TaxID=27406 RepID=A0AAW0YPQ5_CHEQU
MTHSQSGMCDLCGDDHEACNCPMLSQLDLLTKQVEDRESQFAFQSLPSWVQVEDYCQRLRLVVANHSLPKFTKLGPLIAPHTPNLDPATTFPLKICHMGGGHTYLDLSRKWLCNWLSLIPPGSPSNKNLMACQIEDLIYYVASKEIEEGSELRVWYAPFYQHKVKDELKALGYNQSLVGTSVLTRRVPFEQSQAKTPAETYLHVAPSLTRIIVGKDQITFTHSAIQGEREHDNNFIKHPLVPNAHPVADKYFSSEIELEKQITTTVSSSGNYLCEKNIQQKKKDETANEGNFEFCPQVNQSSLVQSIVLVNNRDITREPECIVTFTITAASENSDSSPSHNEHYDNFSLHSEGCLLGDDLHEDSPAEVDGDCKSFKSATPKRKSYKMRVPKSEVCVAESHVVKQLPARALGAREPRPWCCKYCGESFIKLVPFANHLKAHLLWVVGRCHVCKECGGSFSSSLQLHRHQQAAHQHLDFQEASEVASDCRVEHEEPVKHEVYSDDEEAVDDPGRRGYKENTKRISALPTKHVEGPHGCQICSKHFHKAQYLLRHLRKHTGDFTCQFCLKVFARKEGLQKHTCPKGSHQKSLKCSLCKVSLFLNPDLLEQHYLKHKG